MSVDPLWGKYLAYTPYHYAANNPISQLDRSGGDVFSINEGGVVTNITEAEGNHIIKDHSGNQIKFNDPKYDTELINRRDVMVGDQLVNYISSEQANSYVNIAGLIKERRLKGNTIFGEMFNPTFNYFTAISEIRKKSYGSWDFSHTTLAQMANADENLNIGQRSRNGWGRYRDDYKYEQYYFFVFGDNSTAYNLGDAGNFMWGMAGGLSGFSWFELSKGAHLNEFRQGRVGDSKFDQQAIEAGYEFSK
jgi:hypothetical protein